MPLMKSKSKKAFEHNVRAEMHAGKPQDQSLAIAYSVKRKAKKASGGTVESGSKDMNMAEGGEISAKSERRPMPDNSYNDSKNISQNKHMRSNGQDGWTDKPTEQQAKANDVRGKKLPIKRPRMVPSDAFSTRLYDQEGNLEETQTPGPYDAQPSKWMDEDEAKKMGKGPDMAPEHSTHRKPYAKGGMIDDMDHPSKHYMQPDDHGTEEMEREEEADLIMHADPSEDEGSADAHSKNEEGPDRQGPEVPDMEDEHSTGHKPYAEGGRIQYRDAMDYDHDEEMNPAHGHYSADDSEDQPEDEANMEHEDSIAAAIMARKARQTRTDSDSDIDRMMMAEGGEMLDHEGADDILSHDSIYSDDSDQVDLPRNAEEDANEEDQLSWNALRKPNYDTSYWDTHQPDDSNTHSDSEEMDSHDRYDMADEIRRRMKAKRQFKQR